MYMMPRSIRRKKTPAHRFKESEFEPKKGGHFLCYDLSPTTSDSFWKVLQRVI